MKHISKYLAIFLLVLPLAACSHGKHDRAEVKKAYHAHKQSQETLGVAQAFLEAAGSGNGEVLNKLMADDFIWHNEGDASIPWIGTWEGKAVVFGKFMPAFGAGLKVTGWSTDYSFANGNQAVFMGTMSAVANKAGKSTGTFSWAVRVHVENGKVKSWNWFEDSYAVSAAYHGK